MSSVYWTSVFGCFFIFIGDIMYSVGYDKEGNTTLQIGEAGGMISTLTMDAGAVIQLIRLLEATLSKYEEEKDES